MTSPLLEDRLVGRIHRYPAMVADSGSPLYNALTPEYAALQQRDNVEKTHRYLEPILQRLGARRVLDAGCGVGPMIKELLVQEYDAYGFDLLENVPHWIEQSLSSDRFVITDPRHLDLP